MKKELLRDVIAMNMRGDQEINDTKYITKDEVKKIIKVGIEERLKNIRGDQWINNIGKHL